MFCAYSELPEPRFGMLERDVNTAAVAESLLKIALNFPKELPTRSRSDCRQGSEKTAVLCHFFVIPLIAKGFPA